MAWGGAVEVAWGGACCGGDEKTCPGGCGRGMAAAGVVWEGSRNRLGGGVSRTNRPVAWRLSLSRGSSLSEAFTSPVLPRRRGFAV